MSSWVAELEPEVQKWLDGLTSAELATVAFHVDRLAERGSTLRMPYSRSLGEGIFELRFDVGRVARRITFFFPSAGRIVLLTAFRTQRSNEGTEVARARTAMGRCIEQSHTADE